MFLTRMALDMSHEETQHLIRSPQLQYAKVLDAFDQKDSLPQVLWRIDSLDGRLWFVMLSRLRPDLHAFNIACGYQGVFPSWHTIDYDDLLDEIDIKEPHFFELCAIPVKPLTSPSHPIASPTALRNWLKGRSKKSGFRLLSLTSLTSCWKLVDGKYLLFAWWEGKLEIEDLSRFTEATYRGLGYGHDLGAGLLTLSHTDFWGF